MTYSEVYVKIHELKAVAEVHGLKVRFHDHKTNMGDFCIFIYDKNVRKSYMVGFDGNWNSKVVPFDVCLKSAYNWIEKRDKRYQKVNGEWKFIEN